MSVECVVAGGIIIDNVVMPDGAVHRQLVGGNAIHAAIGARLWSDAVGVVGLVPRNYPPEALARLAGALDLAGVRRVDEDVVCSEWFFYAPDGARIDRLYAAPAEFESLGLASDRLSPSEALRWRRHLESRAPQGLDFGGFRSRCPIAPEHFPAAYADAQALHLAPGPPAPQLALLRHERARRRWVTLDPGFHAASLSHGDLNAMLALLDGFLPSEVELAALSPGEPIETALARLGAHVRGVVAVKLGATGSAVLPPPQPSPSRFARGEGARRSLVQPVLTSTTDSLPPSEARGGGLGWGPRRVPALPVTVRDPTGAGDAFCGGFLVGLARTGDPIVAACLGTVSASFAVENVGALAALAADRGVARSRLTALFDRLGVSTRADDLLSRSSA